MEFKIKNTIDQKLKKDYEVIIPKELINQRIDVHIEKIKNKVNLKGFRKGNVPPSIIKEKYGSSIFADESEKLINEALKKITQDYDLKPVITPKVEIKSFKIDDDLEFNATIEIHPEVPQIDLKKIKIALRKAQIDDNDITESLDKLLKFYRIWDKKEQSYKAKNGDAVNINYVGSIDGVEFEGGKADNYQLELGSKSFIDNFEDQLVGKRAGDEVKVKVKFPKEYHDAKFSSKAATFNVKINDVLAAKNPELNDDFIKNTFGMDSLVKLKEEIKKQIQDGNDNISKNIFKKELYDFLVKKYNFDLPEGLVEIQLQSIWSEIEKEHSQNPDKFKNDKEKNKVKEKKRDTAKRMILCGMILSKVAQDNKIEITQEDINKEIIKTIKNNPSQQKEIIEYYQKNSEAISQLRGVIIEEKAVDFIIENSSTEYKKISLKDLEKLWKKISQEE